MCFELTNTLVFLQKKQQKNPEKKQFILQLNHRQHNAGPQDIYWLEIIGSCAQTLSSQGDLYITLIINFEQL